MAREGRNAVTETDLLAVLSHLGFRGFHEPLKKYLQECEVADRVRTTWYSRGAFISLI